MIKKYCLILVVILLCFQTQSISAENIKQINGTGRAILGNGITLEQVQEISYMMAKRDAVEQFGTFIESHSVVKDYRIVEDEVIVISAGIVKLIPNTKEISKEINDGIIMVETTAKFEIDVDKFGQNISKYIEERASSDDIEKLVERVKMLEQKLKTISQNSNISSAEVHIQIENINKSYEILNNALLFPGKKIFSSINDNRINRLNRIIEYLEKLKSVADPYQNITPTIIDKPQINDNGDGKISITINTRFRVNQKHLNRAFSIAEEYKNDIYTYKDDMSPLGRVDNICKSIFGESGGWYYPIVLVFLNGEQEVLALFNINSVYLNINFHHRNMYVYSDKRGAFITLPYLDMPLNEKVKEITYRELLLPEDVLNEISSMKVIYSKYYIEDFKDLNYKSYYVDWRNKIDSGVESLIYTKTPVPLSTIEYTKRDTIEYINTFISKVKNKITDYQ